MVDNPIENVKQKIAEADRIIQEQKHRKQAFQECLNSMESFSNLDSGKISVTEREKRILSAINELTQEANEAFKQVSFDCITIMKKLQEMFSWFTDKSKLRGWLCKMVDENTIKRDKWGYYSLLNNQE